MIQLFDIYMQKDNKNQWKKKKKKYKSISCMSTVY